ncbi:isopentenyl-diphosphate Delta-isomerase [Rhodobacteraceae bacterium KMM 6894]|nr:isopentenyl-diphosphate Delta-isomerase [Rhodobacteraceae bacterium KMM 6894]
MTPIPNPDTTAMLIPAWVDDTLMPVDKLEVHRRGLRHMAVSVFILCGDDVLIQRRALGKYHTPGLWANTCCTHPHWDEPPKVCAVRRLRQELGLVAPDLVHRGQVEYRADVGSGLTEHELVDVFVGRVAARPELALNPDEVMQADWVSLTGLAERVTQSPDQFTPWLRIYLAQHAARIFGAA